MAKKQLKLYLLVTKKLNCLKIMQIVLERETQKTNTYLSEQPLTTNNYKK